MSKREELKRQLEESVVHSQETKNLSSLQFDSYYIIPEGASLYYPKITDKGTEHYLDIIPFYVGKNYPNRHYKKREGDFAYIVDVFIHKNVGPEDLWVVCPKANYMDLKCPVCERMMERQKKEEDDEERKKIWINMRTYRRTLYNVLVYDDEKEEEKGIQIFEVSHNFFEEQLCTLAAKNRHQGTITFPDPDDGKLIKFVVKGSKAKQDWSGYAFLDRIDPATKEKYTIPWEMLDEAYVLDNLLKLPSYDQIMDMMKISEKRSEEETPAERPRTRGMMLQRKEEAKEEEKVEEPPAETEDEPEEDNFGNDECPYGDFGKDFGKLEDEDGKSLCGNCKEERYENCEKEYEKSKRRKITRRR